MVNLAQKGVQWFVFYRADFDGTGHDLQPNKVVFSDLSYYLII